jgi:hypothetical protein
LTVVSRSEQKPGWLVWVLSCGFLRGVGQCEPFGEIVDK